MSTEIVQGIVQYQFQFWFSILGVLFGIWTIKRWIFD